MFAVEVRRRKCFPELKLKPLVNFQKVNISSRDDHCADSNMDVSPGHHDAQENKAHNDPESDNPQLSDNSSTNCPDLTLEENISSEFSSIYVDPCLEIEGGVHAKRKDLFTGNGVKKSTLRCQFCDKYFIRQSNLTRHLQSHLRPVALHHARPRTRLPRICQVWSQNAEERNQLYFYKCKFCLQYFTSTAERALHEKLHSTRKLLKCTNCSRKFKRLCNLKTHMQTHIGHPQTFKCFMCSEAFTQRHELRVHFYINHTSGSKEAIPQNCTDTEKTIGPESGPKFHSWKFYLKCLRDRSKFSNGEERPFQCDICLRRFKQSGNLKSHWDTHRKDKRFKCNMLPCQRSFGDKRGLTRHLALMHKDNEVGITSTAPGIAKDSTVEKTNIPSVIPMTLEMQEDNLCRKENVPNVNELPTRNTFVKNSKLLSTSCKSKRKVDKIFACQVCGKSFPRHDHLIRHMGTHASFKCSGCDMTFVGKKSLRRHASSNNCTKHDTRTVRMGIEAGLGVDKGSHYEALITVPPDALQIVSCDSTSLVFDKFAEVSQDPYEFQNDCDAENQQADQSRSSSFVDVQKRDSDVDKLGHEKGLKLRRYNKNTGKNLKLKTTVRNKSQNMRRKSHHCRFCHKSFSSNSNRNVHERVHTGVKPYKCDVCLRRFAQNSNLRTHKLTHMPDSEKPFYYCHPCSKCFTCKISLKRHLNSNSHMNHQVSRNIAQGVANEMSAGAEAMSTGTENDLTADSYETHASNVVLEEASDLDSETLAAVTPEGVSMTTNPFEGSGCTSNTNEVTVGSSIQFWIDSSAGVHENLAVMPYLCLACGKRFETSHDLTRHERIHEMPHTCVYCERSFATRAECFTHTRQHTNETEIIPA